MSAYPIQEIFSRTSGQCHICFRNLSFSNYGQFSRRGAWEVEHSNPRAAGGTDYLRNLYAACITCNRSKRAGSTRTARRRNGKTRAPLSAAKRPVVQLENAFLGGAAGVALGGALFGSKGAVAGLLFGSLMAYRHDPNSKVVPVVALASVGAGLFLWWLRREGHEGGGSDTVKENYVLAFANQTKRST